MSFSIDSIASLISDILPLYPVVSISLDALALAADALSRLIITYRLSSVTRQAWSKYLRIGYGVC